MKYMNTIGIFSNVNIFNHISEARRSKAEKYGTACLARCWRVGGWHIADFDTSIVSKLYAGQLRKSNQSMQYTQVENTLREQHFTLTKHFT